MISTQVDDRVQRGYYDRTPMEDEDVDEDAVAVGNREDAVAVENNIDYFENEII